MNCTSNWLPAAIADLAAIDNDGRLSELKCAFAADCRAAGGRVGNEERREYAATMRPDAAFQGRALARVAAELFGVPLSECERAAREVLVVDPWREIALHVIAEFRGRDTEQPAVAGHVGNAKQRRARRRVV